MRDRQLDPAVGAACNCNRLSPVAWQFVMASAENRKYLPETISKKGADACNALRPIRVLLETLLTDADTDSESGDVDNRKVPPSTWEL